MLAWEMVAEDLLVKDGDWDNLVVAGDVNGPVVKGERRKV